MLEDHSSTWDYLKKIIYHFNVLVLWNINTSKIIIQSQLVTGISLECFEYELIFGGFTNATFR